MVAMMLPSAAPAVLLYARVRQTRSRDAAIGQTWMFMAGIWRVWLLFLDCRRACPIAVTGPSMALQTTRPSALLIAAGLYQLSPLKSACLSQCRSPAQFISRHWRPGWDGAMRLGHSPWRLLRRLLLAADGAAVRWRCDEPVVGRRSGRACRIGEDDAPRRFARPSGRRLAYPLGRVESLQLRLPTKVCSGSKADTAVQWQEWAECGHWKGPVQSRHGSRKSVAGVKGPLHEQSMVQCARNRGLPNGSWGDFSRARGRRAALKM